MLVEAELRQILRSREMAAALVGEKKPPRREFLIDIGQFEALALESAVHGIPYERPQTHDLVLNVVEGMGGKVRRVIIDKLADDVFFGKLDIELNDHTSVWIDTRPSDGMVLAARTRVPLYIDEQVLVDVRALPPPPEEDEE